MDINDLIDEQFDTMSESTVSNDRILEAMLTRDRMEIEYRNQGYSESQIHDFHEAATRRILEASEEKKKFDSFGHAWRSGSGKWEGVKNVASHLWAKIVELWKKFVVWVKKIYLSVINFFRSDAKFIEKYEKQLKAADKSAFDDVKIKVLKDASGDNALNYNFDISTSEVSDNPDSNEKLMTKIREGFKTDEKNVNDYGIDKIITAFKNTDIKQLKLAGDLAVAKAKKAENDKGKMTDEEAKKSMSYLHAIKAVTSFQLKIAKTKHSNLKAALIRCIARTKKVNKEATIEFMIEQSNLAIEEAYNPFHEADESEKKHFDSFGNAWRSGNGKWEGIKNVASHAGHKIAELWRKFMDWLKKIWLTIRNFFTNDAKLVDKYKEELLKHPEQYNDVEIEVAEGNEDVPAKDQITSTTTTKLITKTYDVPVTTIEKAVFGLIKIKNTEIKTDTYEVRETEERNRTKEELREIASKLSSGPKFTKSTIGKTGGIANLCDSLRKSIDNDVFNAEMKVAEANAKKNADESKGDASELAHAQLRAIQAVAKFKIKLAQKTRKAQRAAFLKCVAMSKRVNKESAMAWLEQADIDFDYAIESVLVEADEVDEVIDNAIGTKSAMGMEDVSQADLSVLGAGASTDPFKLDYEDTNTFSQTNPMGSEDSIGSVGVTLGDTSTHVGSGNQTPAVESMIEYMEQELSCVA